MALNWVSDLFRRLVQRDRSSECETYLLTSFSVLIFVQALAGWDLRPPRLVIHPHVPICLVFCRHALSHFVLARVEWCGSLTSISQTIYKTCSDKPWVSSLNPKYGKTNMTYQSAVQWSITKDLLFMGHLLCIYCFVLLLVVSDLAVADVTSGMWASLCKQASICQR